MSEQNIYRVYRTWRGRIKMLPIKPMSVYNNIPQMRFTLDLWKIKSLHILKSLESLQKDLSTHYTSCQTLLRNRFFTYD